MRWKAVELDTLPEHQMLLFGLAGAGSLGILPLAAWLVCVQKLHPSHVWFGRKGVVKLGWEQA